jgi:hypothetical protein
MQFLSPGMAIKRIKTYAKAYRHMNHCSERGNPF